MSSYICELKRAMEELAKDDSTLFMGQSVACDGTSIRATFIDIDKNRLLELPVCEEMQMGMSIGLALEGFTPVSVFPRFNFLLLAYNQLINHLDKLPWYGGYWPKVIVRTAVGRNTPLDPGWQHQDDFTIPLKNMVKTIKVRKLDKEGNIVQEYKDALNRECSTILVEEGNLY